jgi:molybdopterin-binding protein
MQNKKFRNYLQMLFISLLTAFVLLSCTQEDLTLCKPTSYKLIVKAVNAEDEALGTETVKDLSLYVFDNKKRFLALHPDYMVGQSILLDYPDHDSLMVVAWGNGFQGGQTMPVLNIGDMMDDASISLIQKTRENSGIQSPDDLLHGSITLNNESHVVEKQMLIHRKTSGLVITSRTLKLYSNTTEENFSYVVRQTGSKLNFEGVELGEYSSYYPQASFNNKDEFVAPIFNILTTTSNIEVDIFHGNILKATIIKNSTGDPLRVEAGKTLNVLVDFEGIISVDISVTPWGVTELWKDFN